MMGVLMIAYGEDTYSAHEIFGFDREDMPKILGSILWISGSCGVGEKDSDLEVVVYIVGDPSRDHGDSQGEAPVAAKPPLIVRASIQRPESLIHVLWPKVRE
jgi:hypothetical protein